MKTAIRAFVIIAMLFCGASLARAQACGTLAFNPVTLQFDCIGTAVGGVGTVSSVAVSKTDDTNVTLTVSGSPVTTSGTINLTLGWTSTLAAARMLNAGVHTGDCTTTFPACTISNAAITAAKMVNGGVFTGDATSTFPAITIGNAAITAAKMVNGGVFTGDATSTFPAITIGNAAITAAKMVNGGVHTGDSTSTFPAITISAAAITLAKMANLANATTICRTTAGTGVPEACTAAQMAAILSGQALFTLTTTGSSGAATYSGGTLNIPQYAGGGSANSAFTGSTAVTSSFSATPTFSLADVSVKSPTRFEPGAMTANVTAVTFSNKTAGAKFSLVWLQDGTGGRTVTYGASASNACAVDPTANATTTQFFEVAADGTTVNGVGCQTNSNLLLGPEAAAPGTPAASTWVGWGDSTNHVFSFKANNSATVSVTVVPDTGASNQFLTGISAAGVPSKAQPLFSNLSGAAVAAQLPNSGVHTGDCTTTFPACTISNAAITAAKMVNGGVFTGDVTTTFPAITVAKVNGIAYSATAAAHSVEVITAANATATAKVLPDCTDSGGNHLNFTQSTDAFSCGTSSSGSGGTGTSITSVTPVTVNTNTTADQQLIELTMSAGYFNSIRQPFLFNAAGLYTTQTAQTPTITLKIKLCTVSGCGSGTVVTLATIVSTATIAAVTNNNWNLSIMGYTATTGATGNLEVHGPLSVDLGALTTTADSIFNDVNTAVSSNIDLTAALFVDWTIAFSTNAATANTFTQRQGGVMPFAAVAAPVTSVFTQTGAVGNLTGDVTTTNTTATTIAALAVTNAKIANATIDLTAKVTGLLPLANGGTNCAAPYPVLPKTANYTVLKADFTCFTTITVASGTFTLTLPAVANQPTAGNWIKVLNYGSGVVAIARQDSNLNGGTASYVMESGSATNPSEAFVTSDGSVYFAAGGFTNPMTTAGDVIYAGTTGLPTRLAAGSATQLFHGGTTPSWSAVSLTADVTGVLPTANIALALANQTSIHGITAGTAAGDATVGQVIAHGATTVDFASTATGACATLVTATATGAASTDTIIFNANASIKAVTGYVPASTGGFSISAFPTTNTVSFEGCNWTAGTVDPGSITVNWVVIR